VDVQSAISLHHSINMAGFKSVVEVAEQTTTWERTTAFLGQKFHIGLVHCTKAIQVILSWRDGIRGILIPSNSQSIEATDARGKHN